MALASWFRRASSERIGNSLFLMPPVRAVLAPVDPIRTSRPLGTAVIVATVGNPVFFAAAPWWKFLLAARPVPLPAPLVYFRLDDHQRARIAIFPHP
jgi:rod shape determining protein RodA